MAAPRLACGPTDDSLFPGWRRAWLQVGRAVPGHGHTDAAQPLSGAGAPLA
jgi:hypothetical protein